MPLTDRVAAIFEKVFDLQSAEFSEKLVPEDVLRWDSVGHMALVMELEKQLGVHLEIDDIMEMTSAGKILEILRANGVQD